MFQSFFERQLVEASKVTELPVAFKRLELKGCLSELTHMFAMIMNDEYNMYLQSFEPKLPPNSNSPGLLQFEDQRQIEGFNKLRDFKDLLKLIAGLIIEDIYNNFPSFYLISNNLDQQHEPYHHQAILGQQQKQVPQYFDGLRSQHQNGDQQQQQLTQSLVQAPNSNRPMLIPKGATNETLHQRRVSCLQTHAEPLEGSPQGKKVNFNGTPQSTQNILAKNYAAAQNKLASSGHNSQKRSMQIKKFNALASHTQSTSIDQQETARIPHDVTNTPQNQNQKQLLPKKDSLLDVPQRNPYQIKFMSSMHSASQSKNSSLRSSPTNKKGQKHVVNSFIKQETSENSSSCAGMSKPVSGSVSKKALRKAQCSRQNCGEPLPQSENSLKILALQSELEKLKGRQKTQFFNGLVYSSFQQPKGAQSFRKEQRFKDSREKSPGPGSYGQNGEERRQSLGPATFYRAKKDSFEETSLSPGVGAYEPKYYLIK